METRFDYSKVSPGALQAMYRLHKYVEESGLEHSLLEPLITRVSQTNRWNRLAISFRSPVGDYVSTRHAAA